MCKKWRVASTVICSMFQTLLVGWIASSRGRWQEKEIAVYHSWRCFHDIFYVLGYLALLSARNYHFIVWKANENCKLMIFVRNCIGNWINWLDFLKIVFQTSPLSISGVNQWFGSINDINILLYFQKGIQWYNLLIFQYRDCRISYPELLCL